MNEQIILFIVMFFVGLMFNPMNMLAYRFSDLYLSTTLLYSALFMASNMLWSHQIVHYLSMGHFNRHIFMTGVCLSVLFIGLLRFQLFVNDENWLKRMITHHSTAITTTKQLLDKRKYNDNIFRLAKDIITTQEIEIASMKNFLSS